MANKHTPYNQIIYIRASIDDVEAVEEVGFLSGNDEKFAVYFHPLYDSLDYIVRQKYKGNPRKGAEFEDYVKEKTNELIAEYNIQALTGLGMRGRTFNNAIIIIDEVQSQSQSSLQKMMTRPGKNTKLIIMGSNRQIDNAYVTKYNNGFSVLLNEAAKPQSLVRLHAITLSKVVRSPLADWSELVFTKHKENS